MGLLKMFGSSWWVQPWAHCKLLTTFPSCTNLPIHLSWQVCQPVSMAYLSYSALLSMGPVVIYADCYLMGPHGFHWCNRFFYTTPWSWAHSRCLAALGEFNHGPTVNYWQLFLAAPIGPSIYLGSYSNQCPWPIWAIWQFYSWAHSWYFPTVAWWAHVGFADVIGLFMLYLDHGPTQDVWQLSMSPTTGPL